MELTEFKYDEKKFPSTKYIEEAKRINEEIAEKFIWLTSSGYKQVSFSIPGYTKGSHINKFFIKSVDNLRFSFNVTTLNLILSFNYKISDTLLWFNGDGEYDEVIRLEYTQKLTHRSKLQEVENTLKQRFKEELLKMFKDILL